MKLVSLFVSTEEFDPVSAIIRWHTACAWSHAGFLRKSDMWTFSAMADGKGVSWRPPNPKAKVLALNYPETDKAFSAALTQAGKPYDFLDILGIAAAKDWSSTDAWICDKLVFWACIQAGAPLLNHTFIPLDHLTPRDILLSPLISEEK